MTLSRIAKDRNSELNFMANQDSPCKQNLYQAKVTILAYPLSRHSNGSEAKISLPIADGVRYWECVRHFVLEAPGVMLRIRQSLAAGQAAQASNSARTLNRQSEMLGLDEVQHLASALESALDNHDPTDDLVDRLQQSIEAACCEVMRVLSALKNGKSRLPLAPMRQLRA